MAYSEEETQRHVLESVIRSTLTCLNGYVCFRTANGVPMGMNARKERDVRKALKRGGITSLDGKALR